MSNFLPEGYDKIPSTGKYMKLQDGKNAFRILGSAVIGWLYWNTENRPVRLRERPSGRPMDIRTEKGGDEKIKHFWAFPVWNYAEKSVQILEVTQSTVQSAVKTLLDDENWGDPKKYDISITRSGSGLDTEYSVLGIPPKPLDPKVLEEYAKNPVNLAALFEGGDPFAGKPSSSEAIDPEHSEPTIHLEEGPVPTEPPPVPQRFSTVPEQFRPKGKDAEAGDLPL